MDMCSWFYQIVCSLCVFLSVYVHMCVSGCVSINPLKCIKPKHFNKKNLKQDYQELHLITSHAKRLLQNCAFILYKTVTKHGFVFIDPETLSVSPLLLVTLVI